MNAVNSHVYISPKLYLGQREILLITSTGWGISSREKLLSVIKSSDECKQQQIDGHINIESKRTKRQDVESVNGGLMDVGINNWDRTNIKILLLCVSTVDVCVSLYESETERYNILSLSYSSDPVSPLGLEQPLMDSSNRPWWRP